MRHYPQCVQPVTVTRLSGEGDAAAIAELLKGTEIDLADLREEGVTGLVARRSDDQRPAGYIQLIRSRDGWTLGFIGDAVAAELLRAARDLVRLEGGGHVKLWVRDVQLEDDRRATRHPSGRGARGSPQPIRSIRC